ncbi:hypothetical protein ACWEWU_10805 [Staphylococcus xylosus]
MNPNNINLELIHPTKDFITDEYLFKDGSKITTIIYSDNTVVTKEQDAQGNTHLHVVNRDVEVQQDGKTVVILKNL